jgi:histidinol-phosphate/aromatic aminotransferase/cobyric acid decarboxylase-like protein
LQRTVAATWALSDALREGLSAAGLTVHRAQAPYLLVRTGRADATRAALLRRGLLVRSGASFGLPEWIRVMPRGASDDARLVESLRAIGRGGDR